MAKVAAWHSSQADSDVYHNNNKCHVGNNIERKYRRSGTGGKRLCQVCADLNKK